MPVKVTVVVPVYNPGSHIDDCISSVLGQSLDPGEYEAIFVDDGSTDGTGERLDTLADEVEHVRVIHIPNSGWPGRPRNIGIDNAAGEYVYFVDNDDWLEPTALQQMYDMARRCDSDIVIGKVVGHGKLVGKEIFRRNRDRAKVLDHHLLALLTPHKLFRKSFLDDNAIRFPEGRRRLEDHLMVVEAYFKARVISVLADRPCYHWARRDDETNASYDRFEPRGYYQNLREVLDVVDQHTEPGPERDRYYAHWYRGKMLKRMGPGRLLKHPEDYRADLYTEIKKLADERFRPEVDQYLTVQMRVRSHLLRAGALDDLMLLAHGERRIRLDHRLLAARWEGGVLRLRLRARLVYGDGRPVAFTRDGERLLWDLPAALSRDVPAEARDTTDKLKRGRLDVFIRHRTDRGEHFLPISFEMCEENDADGRVCYDFVGDATLDPLSAGAGGAALRKGIWDVIARVASCGWSAQERLGSMHEAAGCPDSFPPVLVGAPARTLVPYWTGTNGNLSLDVEQTHRSVFSWPTATPPRITAAPTSGALDMTVSLPGQVVNGAAPPPAELCLTATGSPGRDVVTPARVAAATRAHGTPELRLSASVPFSTRGDADRLTPGRWRLSVRMAGRTGELPVTLDVAANGTTKARYVPPPAEPPAGVPGKAGQLSRLRDAARRIPPLRAAVRKVRALSRQAR